MGSSWGSLPSRTSPKGGQRGCLCKDGKSYSVKCCNGSLSAQGIGNITGTTAIITVSAYRVTEISDQRITENNDKRITQ
ncbi:MAG: hypothetical protein EBT39_02560 [Sphingobacteriia bacterium]|nr:hypothetical protein [Candidatus Fonsibacter lacus]